MSQPAPLHLVLRNIIHDALRSNGTVYDLKARGQVTYTLLFVAENLLSLELKAIDGGAITRFSIMVTREPEA